MQAERWSQVGEIFERVLELSPERRASFLDEACKTDPELRREIESLLVSYTEEPAFLDRLISHVVAPSMAKLTAAQGPAEYSHIAPGDKVSHYEILERLGSGGMGIVFKARDTRLDRLVAMKFLPMYLSADPSSKKRFIQEAKAASALDHSNICVVHEVGETQEEQLFIVMPYYEGETLKQLLERRRLTMQETVEIVYQVVQGLESAHEKGIIHRDIKPANIIITQRGEVKILDFGLAKLTGVSSLTRRGSTMGTVSYMSPEQVRGEEVDYRTDIWSLGVMLYEMLAGQRPFKGEIDQAVLYAILNTEPDSIRTYNPELPEDLVAVVGKLLAKKRGERYQKVSDVLTDLETYREGTGRISRIRYGETGSRRSRFMWAFMVLVPFLIGGAWLVGRHVGAATLTTTESNEPSIAVMYFENQTAEKNLERVLVNMLTTNLARYDSLEVVSNQRLFDILRGMSQDNASTINPEVATEVARRANVSTMLTGSIIQFGERIRIEAQLVDAHTGQVFASVQEQGRHVEDIFEMVDRLTQQIGNEMGLDVGMTAYRIADVTTDSFEAYRAYQQGLDNLWRWNWGRAREELGRAVALDSTFALANLYLAFSNVKANDFLAFSNRFAALDEFDLPAGSPELPNARMAIERAKRHAENATEREQRHIAAFYAMLRGDYMQAESLATEWARYFPDDRDAYIMLASVSGSDQEGRDRMHFALQRALEIDPGYAPAYNDLAYFYSFSERHERAIATAKRYLSLYQDVSNTYDTMWEIYMRAGHLQEALDIAEQALRKHPDWIHFHGHIAFTRLLMGHPDEARRLMSRLNELDNRWYLFERQMTGYSFLTEGRFREALAVFQEAVQYARKQDDPEELVLALWDMGKTQAVTGNVGRAIDTYREIDRIGEQHKLRAARALAMYETARLYTLQGDSNRVRSYIDDLNELAQSGPRGRINIYLKLLKAEQENYEEKFTLLNKTLDEFHEATVNFSPHFVRLRISAYAGTGNYDEAIKIYEKLATDPARARYSGDSFEFFYLQAQINKNIGVLYEKKGDAQRAVQHYQRQLDLWANADKNFADYVDTQERLKRIRQGIDKQPGSPA